MSRGNEEASRAIEAREASRAGHRQRIAGKSWVEREQWRAAVDDAPRPAPIRQQRRGRRPAAQEMG